jgi:nucleoside-diphosphate-sugar epimerase
MPLPADDPKQRQPNIDRARSLLEWEPKVPLAEGLQRTVAYFDSVIDRDVRTAATPAI